MKSQDNNVIDYIATKHYKIIKENYRQCRAECALLYAMLLGSVLLNLVMIMGF